MSLLEAYFMCLRERREREKGIVDGNNGNSMARMLHS